mmetsp:Transcript_14005/g.19476  ORF Transcript_14005/g.19476 Transcript_14005/m.19476 type:complete len:173 (-) Transcript_14005:24-542(-)
MLRCKAPTVACPSVRIHNPIRCKWLNKSFCTNLPPHKFVKIPELQLFNDKYKITKWRKQIGDKIASGDVVLEVEDDKVVVEVSAKDDGFLAKKYKDTGTRDVLSGETVGLLSETKEDIAKLQDVQAPPRDVPEKTKEQLMIEAVYDQLKSQNKLLMSILVLNVAIVATSLLH